jgi:hypothetical protein
MDFPFEQIISDGNLVRTFQENVDDEELKWHFDLKDRWVTILDKLFIPKFAWHRVIKGNGNLVVSIEEVE